MVVCWDMKNDSSQKEENAWLQPFYSSLQLLGKSLLVVCHRGFSQRCGYYRSTIIVLWKGVKYPYGVGEVSALQ